MKIMIVGLCHVVGMGETLRRLLPGAEVTALHVRNATDGLADIAAAAAAADLTITQAVPSHGVAALEPERLREAGARRLFFVPPFVFEGYQPDAAVLATAAAMVDSPVTAFNSQILAAAFCLGLPVGRATGLFNYFVYRKLGYDRAFAEGRRFLIDEFEAAGFLGIASAFDDWTREGSFMHTPNHPKIRVLSSIATDIAIRAGLVPAGTTPPADIPDVLDDQNGWPVYPEIAARIGCAGGMTFRRYRRDLTEAERHLDLATFAERSYALFAAFGAEKLRTIPRVAETMAVLDGLLVRRPAAA